MRSNKRAAARSLGIALAVLLALSASLLTPESGRAEFLSEGDRVDAIAGATAILGLDDCAQLALGANDALLQERAAIGELQAQLLQAKATALPRFDLRGNWSRGRDPSFALNDVFGGSGGGIGQLLGPLYGEHPNLTPPDLADIGFVADPAAIPAQTFWRGYVESSWEVHPTQVGAALKAAGHALAQQEHIVLDREHRTVEAVVSSYHDVIRAHEAVQAVDAELEARAEFLRISRRRMELQLVAPLDTLRAAVSLANLRPARGRAERGLRAAGENLNLLMGRDPSTPIALRATFPVEEDRVDREFAIRWATIRPDVIAQQRGIESLEKQRGARKATKHPYLSFDGSYGYVGRTVDSVFEEGHDTWNAAVTLNVPLWDGMTTRGQVQELDATIRRSEYRESEIRRSARAEVVARIDELEVAHEDLDAAALGMEMAAEAYRQISLRYELGRAGYLDVLNAQSERFTARRILVVARFNVLSLTATLKRAMGFSPLKPFSELVAMEPSVEAP